MNETAAPSTPTAAGIARTSPFSNSISPKAFSVEARLELSLDELIKERRKELKKEKKHESIKKETAAAQRRQQSKGMKKKTQSEKRSSLVNKNRGLPAPPASTSDASAGTKKSKSKKKKKMKNAGLQTAMGKKAAAGASGDKRPQLPSAQAASRSTGRKAASPKARVQQQPARKKPQAASVKPSAKFAGDSAGKVLIANEPPRKVVQSATKASKIRITIQQATQSASSSKKRKQRKAAQKNSAVMNVVLPAKVARDFSSRAAVRTQNAVARVVQSRKQPATSKNGAFVVRKPFASRKS